MSAIDPEKYDALVNSSAEKRMQYLFKEVIETKQIWILTDQHGCVMLNSDEEDCVPVWPHEEFAAAWATGEWQDCKPEAIPLATWLNRWTNGLEEDQLAIAVFPDNQQESVVLFPDEFDFELSCLTKKRKAS